VIGALDGFKTILRTHEFCFFFANEVAYNNGVPLKTISRMLGQKSVKTTERYARANREVIASSMDIMEQKLFTKEGELKSFRRKHPS
jgi:site-specific recombinase XerD